MFDWTEYAKFFVGLLSIVNPIGAVWISFGLAPHIASALGKTGINIITRIMGLIMSAIGIEFIANGLKQLFPIFARNP